MNVREARDARSCCGGFTAALVTRGQVLRSLARLAGDPCRSPSVKALEDGGYRLRVGDFRVLYVIENDRLVLVVGVRNRREAYRWEPVREFSFLWLRVQGNAW